MIKITSDQKWDSNLHSLSREPAHRFPRFKGRQIRLEAGALKYETSGDEKIVRSGIWTHAHIRGPERSFLPLDGKIIKPWVWRLRPLGHPDTYFDGDNQIHITEKRKDG